MAEEIFYRDPEYLDDREKVNFVQNSDPSDSEAKSVPYKAPRPPTPKNNTNLNFDDDDSSSLEDSVGVVVSTKEFSSSSSSSSEDEGAT